MKNIDTQKIFMFSDIKKIADRILKLIFEIQANSKIQRTKKGIEIKRVLEEQIPLFRGLLEKNGFNKEAQLSEKDLYEKIIKESLTEVEKEL